MRYGAMALAWGSMLFVLVTGCRESGESVGPPGGVEQASKPTDAAKPAGDQVIKRGATGGNAMADALHFVPAQATAVLMKDHKALREFGLPFLINPGSGFDGQMGGNFSEREVELSVLAQFGGSLERRGANFVACLKLAPDATAQRLINAWQLERDEKTYPDFTCFRSADKSDITYFVVQHGAIVAVGAEEVLKPRLVADAPPGPIEKRLKSLTADHELIVCCLTDYRDLSVAEGYLEPFLGVLDPWLRDLQTLPPGAFNAVTFALRLRDRPRLLVRVEAADASLAAEMNDLFERCVKRLKVGFGDLRGDFKRALPEEGAAEIDEFVAGAITGLNVRLSGQEIDVTVPLGKDGAALRRFTELVQREGGRPFDEALRAARESAQHRDPREQLKQIALAFHACYDTNRRLPTDISVEGKPLLSWRVALLPYLGQQKLYEKFKLDEAWDSEHNQTLLKQLPQLYRDARGTDPTHTTYQVFAGNGASFDGEELSFSKIRDGASHTLMVIQTPVERAVPWTKPQDVPFVATDPTSALGKVPPEGILAAMFDGQVVNLPPNYPSEAWRRLIDPRDGKPVDLPRR